jgi:hypothetical protein
MCAFNAARARSAKAAEIEGENAVTDTPKRLLCNDFSSMRSAFEKMYWVLNDRETPARVYLERKLEMIEKGDIKAERLSEVLNLRDDDSTQLRTVWGPDLTLKAVKAEPCVSLPRNPEELRQRMMLPGCSPRPSRPTGTT